MMRIESKNARLIIGLVLTVYLFWGINRPNRFLFSNLEINDVRDLGASLIVIAIAAAIFYAFRKKNRIPFLISSIGSWIVIQFLLGYWYYTLLNNIPLANSAFYRIDLPLSLALFTFWSVVLSSKDRTDDSETAVPSLKFQAYSVDKELLISADDLTVAYRDQNKCFLVDLYMQSYTTNFTISSLEEKLSETDYFRINRSTIIHRKLVKGIQPQGNRTILLIPEKPLPEAVDLVISRAKAPRFKRWWSQRGTIQN